MLPPDQFAALYNFRKPSADDLLIMSSERGWRLGAGRFKQSGACT